MLIKRNHFSPLIATITIFFVIAKVAYPINGLESRKLDDNTVPGVDRGVKCNPSCITPPSPPPPSPPLPCPPPPPACPLPPPAITPPTQCCPVPPCPPYFICVTGSPGTLYPIYQNLDAANQDFELGLLALISGFLVLLAI